MLGGGKFGVRSALHEPVLEALGEAREASEAGAVEAAQHARLPEGVEALHVGVRARLNRLIAAENDRLFGSSRRSTSSWRRTLVAIASTEVRRSATSVARPLSVCASLLCPHVVAKQHLADVDMPEQVTLSLAELARSAKEHLLSLPVGLGLLTLKELLEAELTRLVGRKGQHRTDRTAYRHGSERRSVTLGGRLVEVERPCARTRQGREIRLPTYDAVADRDLLTEAALGRMLAGLSTRHYADGLEPVGDVPTRGTSRSAVSRRFARGTAAKPAQLRSRDLTTLGLLALFIDGIESGGHTIVLALGVDAKGEKHTLGLWEGTTENAAVCQALLSSLIERGLPTDRALLFVIGGGKAVRKAIRDTYGALAPVQRCRLHYADLRMMPTPA